MDSKRIEQLLRQYAKEVPEEKLFSEETDARLRAELREEAEREEQASKSRARARDDWKEKSLFGEWWEKLGLGRIPKPVYALGGVILFLVLIFFIFDDYGKDTPVPLMAELEQDFEELEKALTRLEKAKATPVEKVEKEKAFQESLEKLEELAKDSLESDRTGQDSLEYLKERFKKLEEKFSSDLVRARLSRNSFSSMDLALTEVLSHYADPDSTDFCLNRLSQKEIPLSFRRAYAEELAEGNPDPSKLPVMESFVRSQSEDESIRITMMKAIIKADAKRSLDILKDVAMNDPNKNVRTNAMEFLKKARAVLEEAGSKE